MHMVNEVFELRHIFGLKIKEIRQEKGITYQELREKTGLSISYLSEIENGKKYPKGDKIMLLSTALEVSYDELVSLKVPTKLKPIVDLIQSDFFKAFPLQEFGLDPQKMVEIVSQSPVKVNAFINTVMQIARSFELNKEKFFYAALRSYQELHNNYFPELENAVAELNLEFPELKKVPFTEKVLTRILLSLGVRVNLDELPKEKDLSNIRSIYHTGQRVLLINDKLTSGQRNFLLAREIAFQWLKLKNRPYSTPPIGSFDFEGILNNYKASYFAAALMMPEKNVVKDIKLFASAEKWNSSTLENFIEVYDVTPEMLMQRLTNILPHHFGLKNLFFLRFLGEGNDYNLTKELHLTAQHNPHTNELNHHYCRRWISINLLKEVLSNPKYNLKTQAQISKYYETKNEYLCLSMAFPNVSNKKESISVTIGFLLNRNTQTKLNFLKDTSIISKEVNTTCERCPIPNCSERAAKPILFDRIKKESAVESSINGLLNKKAL